MVTSQGQFQSAFVLTILLISDVFGCYKSGWGLLSDDLLCDLCPVLSDISDVISELFLAPHSLDDDLLPFSTSLPLKEEEKPAGPITSEMVTESLKCGKEITRSAKRRGNQLVRNGITLDSYPPSMLHFYSPELLPEERKAVETSHGMLTATKLIQMKVCSSSNVTPNTFMSFLEHQIIRVKDPYYCKPVSITCTKTNYRTIDGTCNNLKHPEWGRRGAPFTRLASPRYADGIYAMPLARSGRALPSPRTLSTRLFASRPVSSRVRTHINMQWGQYVTHDMLLQVMETTDEGGIQCCLGNGQDVLPSEWQNDKCIPICVPEDDPFYRYHGIKCLNFVRSVTAPRDDCSFGYAEQMNTVTSYLDGSPTYGSDAKTAYKLRSRRGGRLREDKKKPCSKGFLPAVDDKMAACDLRNVSEPCYLAGDIRINQTPTLAALQTIMLREHNRVADILSDLNPTWSDERLYQEARRIVIAEIQHITYQEWLPLNFGENYFRYYRISPSSLYSRDYNADASAGVINAFGAAAFRFLHTIVPDHIMTCPASYTKAYMYKLSDYFFNPSLLEAHSEAFDDLIRGSLLQSSDESDPHCSSEITNLLFKSHNKWGLDLISMDIQRGRDHGLASYNDYREVCGLRRATTFQDLASEISQDRINAIAQLYECVDDIDLFVGGAMERVVQGSIVGPTFQCIVAEQFYRTRIGDRFFYDNSDVPHSFTSEQLQQLKKATMARFICDNTEGIHFVQRKAFELESTYNPKYSCNDYNAIPYVDLTAWKVS